jgi:hypothetical protein
MLGGVYSGERSVCVVKNRRNWISWILSYDIASSVMYIVPFLIVSYLETMRVKY